MAGSWANLGPSEHITPNVEIGLVGKVDPMYSLEWQGRSWKVTHRRQVGAICPLVCLLRGRGGKTAPPLISRGQEVQEVRRIWKGSSAATFLPSLQHFLAEATHSLRLSPLLHKGMVATAVPGVCEGEMG